MPIHNQPASYLVAGSALGAVIRYLIAEAWRGSTAILVTTAASMVAAGLVAGLALGLPAGRPKALLLGLGGSVASFSMYAVAGVTSRPVTNGVLFLVTMPVLIAGALTIGVLLTATWAGRRERRSTTR
jgi:CrcB protein